MPVVAKVSRLVVLVVTSVSMLAAGCASTMRIASSPAGAEVYVDGQPVGTTPMDYTDSATVMTRHEVVLKLAGYKDKITHFTRGAGVNVGAAIGCFFVMIPCLWILDYPLSTTYELEPAN